MPTIGKNVPVQATAPNVEISVRYVNDTTAVLADLWLPNLDKATQNATGNALIQGCTPPNYHGVWVSCVGSCPMPAKNLSTFATAQAQLSATDFPVMYIGSWVTDGRVDCFVTKGSLCLQDSLDIQSAHQPVHSPASRTRRAPSRLALASAALLAASALFGRL